MKGSPSADRSGIFSLRAALLIVGCALVPLLAVAVGPEWWIQRGVVIPNLSVDDFALANQGQVKNIATAAVSELDSDLPGGAGNALHNLVRSWAEPNAVANDFAPVNAGQL